MSPFKGQDKKSCLKSLILEDSHPLLANARNKLILLSLHAGIHLLIKLGCHLYDEQGRLVKKKKKEKKAYENLLFSSICIANRMKEKGYRPRK